MTKLVLCVAVLALAVAPSFAAKANPAETVPFDHWAYDAVQTLVDQGIIIGYPDGAFRGDRAMTRYEFAMAVSRLLDVVATTVEGGKIGPKGDTGAAGRDGVNGVAGRDGAAGPGGVRGDTGPIGPRGDAGAAGPMGPDGRVGLPGAPGGAAGPKGDQGGMGPAGPAGPPGPPGPETRGPVGPTGPRGDMGPAGPTGGVGPAGAPGGAGPTGLAGATGATGPAGVPGAAGPTGATGPVGGTGPVGPAGPKPTEDEIRAICKKLMDEFADDIKALRDDLDYLEDDVYDLADRVAWLEENAKGPKAFGYFDYRIGYTGDMTQSGAEFDNLTAKLGITGKVTNDLSAKLVLKVRDSSDAMRSWFDETAYSLYAAPAVDGNPAETVWLDEAALTFPTKGLVTANWTVGRSFVNYGLGLVVNNERKSQQGLRAQFSNLWNTNLDLDVFAGGASYTFAQPPGTTPDADADGYLAGALTYARPSWKLSGVYLHDGYGNERAWGADLWAKFWGRELYAEYGEMMNARSGRDFDTYPHSTAIALMAMLDVWKGKNFALRGFYSDVDAGYDLWYSTLNPYYEQYAHSNSMIVPWERWLRNPLAMTNVQALGGQLEFNLGSTPFEIAYYDLDANSRFWEKSAYAGALNSNSMADLWSGDGELPYNRLFSIRMSREVADGVKVGLTWAKQNANRAFRDGSLADQELLSAEVTVPF